jgi:hypothetical protein
MFGANFRREKHYAVSPASSEDHVSDYVAFLMKRLDHIIGWTQNATSLIYAVNGAILAAMYFSFGNIESTPESFALASVLSFILSLINFLHANFIRSGYAWYIATEEEIRNVFSSLNLPKDVTAFKVGERQMDVFLGQQRRPRLLRIARTHAPMVWLHVILAFLLFLGAAVMALIALLAA